MAIPEPPVALFGNRDKSLDTTKYSYKLAGSNYGLAMAIDHFDIDEKRMSLRFPFASSVARDGVGDLLEVGGIRLDRHAKNPIVGLDHFKHVQLPIGKAEDPETGAYTVDIDMLGKTAWLTCFFYQGKGGLGARQNDEYDHALLCEQLFDLAAKRYIRAGSIGYQVVKALKLPADYEQGTPPGLHLLVTLMLEGSLVVLPANGDTVRKALALPQVCGKALSPVLVKSLSPYAEPSKVMTNGIGEKEKAKSIPTGSFSQEQLAKSIPAGVNAKFVINLMVSSGRVSNWIEEQVCRALGLTEHDLTQFGRALGRANDAQVEKAYSIIANSEFADRYPAMFPKNKSHTSSFSQENGKMESGAASTEMYYASKGAQCNVREYRSIISGLSDAFSSLRSVATAEEWNREAESVKRWARELMNTECPRASNDDKLHAERLIDQTAVYIGNRQGIPGPRRDRSIPNKGIKSIRAKYKRIASGEIKDLSSIRRKYMTQGTKSLNVRYRSKVIKGFAEVQVKFALPDRDRTKQAAMFAEMEASGYGRPQGVRWSEDGKDLASTAENVSYKFCLEPGKSLPAELEKLSTIAAKHGARLVGNTKS